jgi:hypothetical protein
MSDELEPTERSRIRDLIAEQVKQPTIGEVQEVFPHTGNESRPSNHEVTVSVPPGPTPTETYQRRPVVVPTSGAIVTPQKGDLVLLQFPKRSDKPFVTGVVYGDQDKNRAPKGAKNVVRLTRGSLYAEIAGDGSSARIAKKPDDTEDPTAKVEIDDAGTVTVETDGDITVSAGGNVVIDEGGTAKPVARQDHTHPYSWSDSGGSGDTDTPNESGTSTEIE